MSTATLKPIPGTQKSFYNKAHVVDMGNGTIFLKSYGTTVCKIVDGRPFRTWGGYSATTMRHINAFLAAYGAGVGGKKWWDAQPVNA